MNDLCLCPLALFGGLDYDMKIFEHETNYCMKLQKKLTIKKTNED